MYCSNCGSGVDPDATYCQDCGEKLSKQGTDTSQSRSRGSQARSSKESADQPNIGDTNLDDIHTLRDESVFVGVNPHWYSYFAFYALGGLLLTFGLLTMLFDAGSGLLILIIGASILVVSEFHRQSKRYIITDTRVIRSMSFFGDTQDEVRIHDIENIQTSSEFLSGGSYGTVRFSTTSAGGNLIFKSIPRFQEIANIVRELREIHHDK